MRLVLIVEEERALSEFGVVCRCESWRELIERERVYIGKLRDRNTE